ncbi:hypothetical protein IJI64_02845 [Candidatus Saccharibacteria bacterium]|nr:hypothetical protein [Candidatus Saccharibacteria bacterium]
MSKTTKIIAALGVVAGLGVAALPAFTYAADPITGNVDVIVEVEPAIAMTISGNNDTGNHETAPSGTTYGPVDVFSPSGAASSSIAGHTTPAQPTTTVSSTWTSLLPNAHVFGDDTNEFRSVITVYTNNAAKYSLGISALAALTNVETGVTASIPANGIVKDGTAGWGYSTSVIDTQSDGTTPNYETAAATLINGTVNSGVATNVYYGVSTAADQATGTYRSSVTYTATAL